MDDLLLYESPLGLDWFVQASARFSNSHIPIPMDARPTKIEYARNVKLSLINSEFIPIGSLES